MSILSLALYGSRARNDYSTGSDTDLFAITTEADYKMIVEGSTNIACYPRLQAYSRAEGGDLYFMHIVTEGVPLYDNDGDFQEVKRRFTYKKSYFEEVDAASNLGYALILNKRNTHNFLFFNKRLVWCVRTMLIARSAEQRDPVFSAEELGRRFDDRRIPEVIRIKSSSVYESKVYKMALELLLKYGTHVSQDMPSDYGSLVGYFERRKNAIGAKTAKLLAKDVDTGEYEWI